MTRPPLLSLPLDTLMHLIDAGSPLPSGLPLILCTMSPGQWDTVLQAAYNDGCILLEVDGPDDAIVAAYYNPAGRPLGCTCPPVPVH